MSDRLQRRVASLLKLSPTTLPLNFPEARGPEATDAVLEQGLARLGYPGLAYRAKPGERRNPGELLLMALGLDDLDPRLAEALPWLLLRFEGLDTGTLLSLSKRMDLQNRLGFTVSLARGVAEKSAAFTKRLDELRRFEHRLERSRLVREDTYCQARVSNRMRCWLMENRTPEAVHWNLLTDLKPEHLPYV